MVIISEKFDKRSVIIDETVNIQKLTSAAHQAHNFCFNVPIIRMTKNIIEGVMKKNPFTSINQVPKRGKIPLCKSRK